ncbi:MAG: HxsD-like protein [bacterium]
MAATSGATVRLHRGLYAHDAITQAAATFADFAAFAVRTDGDHYVVDVSDIDGEVEGDVVAEFLNFALANSAIRRKRSDA